MIKKITYKLQGQGTDNEFDSWIIEYEDENRVSDIVYEDPNNSQPDPVDMSNVDLTTMTQEQLTQLKNILGL